MKKSVDQNLDKEYLIPTFNLANFLGHCFMGKNEHQIYLSEITLLYWYFTNRLNLTSISTNFLKCPLDYFFFLRFENVFHDKDKRASVYKNVAFKSNYHQKLVTYLARVDIKDNPVYAVQADYLFYQGILEIVEAMDFIGKKKEWSKSYFLERVFLNCLEKNWEEKNFKNYLQNKIKIYHDYLAFPEKKETGKQILETFKPTNLLLKSTINQTFQANYLILPFYEDPDWSQPKDN